MTVLIVGAGIGGLATALALHARGIACEIHEQVAAPRPLGVGINLLPHAVKVLTGLGVADRLDAVAIRTRELAYFNKHGQEIWREPRGLDAGYNWPQFSIHRGELQMILLAAVRERLGAERVGLGQRIAEIGEGRGGSTRVRIVGTGGVDLGWREGDLVIAADGIRSAIRAQLMPGEGPPRWNGAILWRGVTEDWAPFLSGRSMIMAGHQNQKFVCYPISRAAHARGRARLNWIAELRFDPTMRWRREDWNRPGLLDEFLPAFESWRFDWLDVPALIRGAEGSFEYPMVDRDPLPRWTFGSTTLLGDAAHPMYPIGSNGASQAILDAAALARAIAAHGTTPEALLAYEAERRPPTSAIVLANRGNGPEQVMQLAEERAPAGFTRIEDVIPRAELEEIALRYKRLAGFDPATLNATPA
jgi:5-methylphenazine-1-carboxylate 1-monooxygenase